MVFWHPAGWTIYQTIEQYMRQAQREPERFSTLQIRVTGWSVYFTELSREEQDTFIERCVHGI